jgi:phosphotransferase system enzyme I (PtsP)
VASRKKVYEHRGQHGRLEGVIELARFAARPMPLVTLLDEAPHRIAGILGADVCSIYVLEGEGTLVMRGNIGFPREALGQVRLAVGEGITGEAVEYMRPITAELAAKHASYKPFADLGEERFPVFLAVPIRGRSGPLGAVVVQRRTQAFVDADVELLVLMGALIAAGIRTAELIDASRERAAPRRAGGGTRKVTLPGRPLVPGRALGAVAALRRPAQHPSERIPTKGDAERDVALLKGAFDTAEKALRALRARARQLELGAAAAFLGTYEEILSDARMREIAIEQARAGGGIADALGLVARGATRTAIAVTRDAFLEERARDVEDLCDALTMLAARDKRAEIPNKAILLGDNLTVFDVLVTSRTNPVGVALSDRAQSPRLRTLVELMGIPAIVDVRGLFRWASDGDLALIDADHGLLVLNPSKSEVASMREWRKEREEE